MGGIFMYYVTIINYHGQKIRVGVSKEIFDVFEDSRKQGISEDHQQRDYMEKRSLDNPFVDRERAIRMKSLEDQYLIKERLEQTLRIIESCSPTQKERYILFTIYGYKCSEIAAFHGCSKRAVYTSISKVRKKIMNIL